MSNSRRVLIHGRMMRSETFEELKNSNHELEQKSYHEYLNEFEGACRALGTAFAEAGYSISLIVPEWDRIRQRRDAVRHVIQGINDSTRLTGKYKLTIYIPGEPEPLDKTPGTVDTLQEYINVPDSRVEYETILLGSKHSYLSNAMLQYLNRNINVVIVLGGGEGTAALGFAAVGLFIPVIAVTHFGGASRELDKALMEGAYRGFVRGRGIPNSILLAGRGHWQEIKQDRNNPPQNLKISGDIVTLAGRLRGKLAMQFVGVRQAMLGAVITAAISIAFWILLFTAVLGELPDAPIDANIQQTVTAETTTEAQSTLTTTSEQGQEGCEPCETTEQENHFLSVALAGNAGLVQFVLLFLATLIGVCVNIFRVYRDENIVTLTPLNALIEGMISIVLAFVLYVLYAVSAFAIQGDFDVLLNIDNASQFGRIAITMTLFGFVAGYLQPLEAIEQRLIEVMGSEHNINIETEESL